MLDNHSEQASSAPSRTTTGGKESFFILLAIMFFSAFIFEKNEVVVPEDSIPLPATPEIRIPVPDFASIQDVDAKKQMFFDFLQPHIDAKNLEIIQQRQHVSDLRSKVEQGLTLNRSERIFLRELATDYEVDVGAEVENLRSQDFFDRLLRKVDVLPSSLVLAQAANESAWGTSRFARQGYNFFGQWCYTEGCGIVPNRRRPNARHEVKAFDSVAESVHAYFMNINTFPSYRNLRSIRLTLRQLNKDVNGLALAEGLGSYSERGEEYIAELKAMIEFNDLDARDERDLSIQL